MKRKILILSILVICVASLAAGSLAYFTADGTAHNVITTGGVGIQLVEQTKSGDALVDFPKEGLSGILPGASASKIVSVKNTGTAEAWIRVSVTMNMTDSDQKPLPTELSGADGVILVITFTANDDWTQGEDGYYYYKNPVAAGSSTTTLFDEVHFAKEMGNEYQNCTANLIVSAQAVQTANNGKTVAEAQGWPAENQE